MIHTITSVRILHTLALRAWFILLLWMVFGGDFIHLFLPVGSVIWQVTPLNMSGNQGPGFQVVHEDKSWELCLPEKLREERERDGVGRARKGAGSETELGRRQEREGEHGGRGGGRPRSLEGEGVLPLSIKAII